MSEQERNLRVIRNVARVIVAGVILLGWVLFEGYELPPDEMGVQRADSTGYRPPPRPRFAVGSVPRRGTGLGQAWEERMPDLPAGAIPQDVLNRVNPLAAHSGTAREGGRVYAVNCAMCHGQAGRGDGPVGESYTPRPSDLTTPGVQRLPDGALFYLITNGILSTPFPEAAKYLPREWHAFRSETTERERWSVVSFVRTLPG